MPDDASAAGRAILARLDRIPVWPYPWSVLIIVGFGFFFAFFDIVTIGFAQPHIVKQFGVTAEAAAWSITASLLGYIVGSLLDARIADKLGRRRALFVSITLFTVGTLLSATSPNLTWLIIWRVVSGMGIGAEIAAVTTYLSELAPPRTRGRSVGWAVAAGFLGFAAVPIVARWLLPEYTWGWRALFVIGGIGGLAIAVMRRGLPRSPRWLVEQGHNDEAAAVIEAAEACARERLGTDLPAIPPPRVPFTGPRGLRALRHAPWPRRLLLFAAVWFLYYTGNYAWLTEGSNLLGKEGVTLTADLDYFIVTGIGFVIGAVAAALFADRLERKITTACVAGVWALLLVVFGWFPQPWVIMGAGLLASATIGLLVPILYAYTAESFPTHSRATCVSITDGIGHLGGAVAPIFALSVYNAAGFAWAFTAMGATGAAAGLLVLCGARMTGRGLDQVDGHVEGAER